MMTTISERLEADLKTALKAGERVRVEVIRSARADLQQAQLEAARERYETAARTIEARYAGDAVARDAALAAISADYHEPLAPEMQEAVLARAIKRRREAAEMYQRGGRPELAAAEEAEAVVLQTYLPPMLSRAELRPLVAAVISELGLSGPAAMGRLMPVLIERFKGRAEGRDLSLVARELLAGS